MTARGPAEPRPPATDVERLMSDLSVAYTELEAQSEERRLAQTALLEAHALYAELFREAPTPLLVLRPDGTLGEYNDAAADLAPSKHELHAIGDLLHSPHELREVLRALAARERLETEWTVRGRQGLKVLRAFVVPRPTAGDAVVSLVDVTALRASERTQRAVATRFRALVRGSRDGILVFHARSWMVLECNPAFAEMVGGREGIVGMQITQLLAEGHRGDGEMLLRRALTVTAEPFRLVFGANGGEMDTEAVLSPVEGDSSAMLVVRDDRARRQLDEERESLRERATHSQKLEALGRLSAGVAHDLNNALAVISSTVESFDSVSGPDEESLGALRAAVERASQTTSALLAYGRSATARRVRVDLCALLARDVAMLRRALPRTVRLSAEAPHDPLWVLGEEASLHQSLMNLVLNARDAVGDDGSIRVVMRGDAERVELAVRDSGPGVPRALRGRIFEPFFTTKEPGRGTGLGLSLVWSMARAHGGDAWVADAPGGGAEIGFWVPRDPSADPSLPPSPAVVRPRGLHGLHVLLVDDEAPVLRSHRRLLSRLDTVVHEASTLEEALAQLPDADVVLCDYQLGTQNGLDLLRAMRGATSALPFILVTGYLDEDGERSLRSFERTGFLQKPFRAEDAIAEITRLCG